MLAFPMDYNDKIKLLKKLGARRKANCYPGFKNLSDFHNGLYESDFVSPYTKGSGNANSKIFILLQDWTSEDRIQARLGPEAVELGYSPALRTNINLQALLKATFHCQLSDVFTTNLFPFIKPGKMDATIGAGWLKRAFEEYALPQINIVNPDVVICCGKAVYRIVVQCLTGSTLTGLNYGDNINHRDFVFFCQHHPGARGTIAVGGQSTALKNWNIMKEMINGESV